MAGARTSTTTSTPSTASTSSEGARSAGLAILGGRAGLALGAATARELHAEILERTVQRTAWMC